MEREHGLDAWRKSGFCIGGPALSGGMLLLVLLCPPLAVYWTVGAGPEVSLNILLTLLGYLPGVIHAAYILATHCHACG